MSRYRIVLCVTLATCSVLLIGVATLASSPKRQQKLNSFDRTILANNQKSLAEGRETFRFDTFGDEDYWGGTLQLHRAIEGTRFGGVGPGVSPRTALSLGLKVDVDALPPSLQEQLKHGKVDLDDPATTLALLKLNSVVGLTGLFNPNGSLKSLGIQCAMCH